MRAQLLSLFLGVAYLFSFHARVVAGGVTGVLGRLTVHYAVQSAVAVAGGNEVEQMRDIKERLKQVREQRIEAERIYGA